MEIKKLEKYLIKKEKTDMLSSLKKVNKWKNMMWIQLKN